VKLRIAETILELARANLAIDASDEENHILTRLKGADFNCAFFERTIVDHLMLGESSKAMMAYGNFALSCEIAKSANKPSPAERFEGNVPD